MFQFTYDRIRRAGRTAAALSLMAVLMAASVPVSAKDKKQEAKTPAKPTKHWLDVLDYSKIVWPAPPAIARLRYLNFFSGEKYKPEEDKKKKASWKDRLAGLTTGTTAAGDKPRFQLIMPYGMAVDSKGRLYVADRKVKAIFIVEENGAFEMIKNGVHARFGNIIGLAIDDADRLFVSDSQAKRVMVFDAQHSAEAAISEGLSNPGGLALDNENRFLYVADSDRDQVLVYDADPPFKLLRTIGTTGKKHTLTGPGELAMPSNVAVDQDGNLYVSDTLNCRVQIFDADGNFIRTWGKAGDAPGHFARPKGIAIDADGHVWVADAVQNKVQAFTKEGRLLMSMGGTGIYPGQFRTLAGLAIDKNNRVFTSEQFPGRVQIFRYVTEAEANAEQARRDAEGQKRRESTAAKDAAAPPPQDSAAKK